MRALTLKQPMASALAAGVKNVENRPRPTVPQGWRLPVWVAVHAGSGWWFDADEPSADFLAAWPSAPRARAEYPAGALLGVVEIEFVCEEREPGIWGPRVFHSPWTIGPWCLGIRQAVPLQEPIPCAGSLGFWRVLPALTKQVGPGFARASLDRLEQLLPDGVRVPA